MAAKRKKKARRRSSGRRPVVPLQSRSPDALLADRVGENLRRVSRYAERAEGDAGRIASLAEGDIEEAMRKLVTVLEPWNPLDALTWLRMANLPLVDGYRESTHDGLLAVVEIAGLAVLGREPSSLGELRAGERPVADAELDHPGKVAALCREVGAIVRDILGAAMASEVASASSEGPDAYVRFRVREREVLLRNVEYPHIRTEHLRAQLGREAVRGMTVEALRFDVDDALAVIGAFEDRFNAVISDRMERASAEIGGMLTGDDPRLVAFRAEMGSRLPEVAQAFAAAYVGDQLGRRIAIGGAELAEVTGISEERVGAVLDAFSQPFMGAAWDPISALRAFLRGENPWRLTPILATSDGRYLCIDVGLMLSAVREVVEAGLSQSARPAYAKETAQWMEDAGVAALVDLLHPDAVHRNVEYIAATGAAVELDALIVCDTVALAVEAKGTTLTPRSRTGDRARMARDLERIVTKTFQQADRVRSTIEARGGLLVRGRDAQRIPLERVGKVFPIALTLEDVSTIAGTVDELLKSGLIKFDGVPPWLVSLHDLRVITEIVDGPAQFLAYLDQHEKAVTAGVLAVSEELDLFMLFLQEGLWLGDFLDDAGKPTERLFVPSRTDDLDAYYLHKLGGRTAYAPRPSQRWNPKGMRELLVRLQDARPHGWPTAAINLQRGDSNVRRAIASAPRRLARLARRDGRVHDETRCFEDPRHDRFGITVLAAPSGWGDAETAEVLRDLVTARKYVQRARSWTGLAVCATSPDTVRVLVQLDGFWEPDRILDELVARLGMRPAKDVGVAPTSG